MEPDQTAHQAWVAIKDNYHNNALTHTVYLEAEFHNLQ
jgi:hypothetical protein